jgi:alkylated DNA repair dioxygenase AlkB
MTPIYRANAVESADELFEHLWNNLPWEKRGETPRHEVFYNESGIPYTYGVEPYERTYVPFTEWDEKVAMIKAQAEHEFGVKFEACFINGYSGKHHSLQWHADDSPSIDHTRPILVYSFGAEREIWVGEGDANVKGIIGEPSKFLLGNGSLFVMPPGMQQTHKHRIPKHDRECGPRVSLTFRGLL